MKQKILRVVLVLGMLIALVPSYRTGAIHLITHPINTVREIVVVATCYIPTSSQCDSTPAITASNKKIDTINPLKHRWIAVSRDLLKHLSFGDTVEVSGTGVYDGKWIVNDVMNKRHKQMIDFLVGGKNVCRTWHDVKLAINN